MGKASRKKRERQSKPQTNDDANRAIAALKELGEAFAVLVDDQLVTADISPLGASVRVFADEPAAEAWAQTVGLDRIEVDQLGPVAEWLELMAEVGASSIRSDRSPFEIRVACRLSEVTDDQATQLLVGPFDNPLAILGRHGKPRIAEPSESFYPWRRWDLIDQGVRQSIDRQDLPSGAVWWEVAGEDDVTLVGDLGEFGPFPTQFGAVPFFQSEQAAADFSASLRDDQFASVHIGPAPRSRPKPRPVSCLATRLREILPGTGSSSPIILNPGARRDLVALGTVGRPLIRTVDAVWELGAENRLTRNHSWTAFSGADTLNWRGTDGNNSKARARTHMLTTVRGGGPDEAAAVAEASLEDEVEVPRRWLDAFLTVIEDRFDPALSVWRLTGSPSRAASHLLDLDERDDRRLRVNGDRHVPWLVPSLGNRNRERRRSHDLRRAVIELGADEVQLGYTPRCASAMAAAVNEIFGRFRVRAMGWVRDLAADASDYPDWIDDLLDMFGPQRTELLEWIHDNDALPVAPEAREELTTTLGEEVWRSLDLRSRHFLGTAVHHLRVNGGRDDLDHSQVIVMCGKTLEVEINELIGTFRDSSEATLPHDEANRNDKGLRSFLDGTGKLTLGSYPYLLRPKAEDSELRQALGRYVAGLPGGPELAHRRFSKKLTKLSHKRNPASHDRAITEDEARSALDLLIEPDALIATVTAWKQRKDDAVRATPQPTPIPFPFEPDGDSLRAERYTPRFDEGAGLDPEGAAYEAGVSRLASGADHEDEGWLEHLDWMIRTGLLDDMVANGDIEADLASEFRSIHRRWQQLTGSLPATASLVDKALQKVVRNASHDIVHAVDDQTGEVVWPIIDGVVLARGSRGEVVLVARGIPTAADPAADLFSLVFDERTVTSLAAWLSAGGTSLWRHRRDLLVVRSEESDGGKRLQLILRHNRPPGGHFPVRLDRAGSDTLATAIAQLASGDWGPLAQS